MTLTDFGVGAVRTLVTAVMGAATTWLIKQGIDIDQASATMLVQSVVTGLYWMVISKISKRFPKAQWALGYPIAPSYSAPDPAP
jgi:peptidoglycan biosynthesis protein MviN/MurJ (putative lipid II flippase)